jgi:nucleotide-binding universal stress UspA family protein
MEKVVSASAPPIVVGVDGSRNHLATLDLAVDEAVRRRAPLMILHVWPGRYAGSLRTRGPTPTIEDGRHLLDVAARRAAHRAPALSIDTELIDGSVADTLVRRSSRAPLLVVGHRDDVLTRHGWGSTAAYLAHHSACPLLVYRGAAPARGPVVLAASATESGRAAVAFAFDEAATMATRLVAVHVWTHPAGRGATTAEGYRADYAASRDEADRQLAEALAGWAGRYPDLSVERLVLHDLDVAYTLERAARRGRLLVAGMGGNSRFAELLYGSLSLSLMRTTACPVLLVPTGWGLDPAEPPAVTADVTGHPL